MRKHNTALAAAPRRGYSGQGRSTSGYQHNPYAVENHPYYAHSMNDFLRDGEVTNPALKFVFDALPKDTRDKMVSVAKANNLDLNNAADYPKAFELAKNTITQATGGTTTGATVKIPIAMQPKDKQMEEATKRGAFALGGALVLGGAAFFLTPKLPGHGLITAGAAVVGFVGTAVAFNIADPIDYGKLLSGDAPQTTANTGTPAPEQKK